MLATAAACVRSGGVLVYSTCTIAATENEQQIETFLHSHADFNAEPVGDGAPSFATMPHRDRTAGFSVARLRRG